MYIGNDDLEKICAELQPCLKNLKNKHLLLTGGTGFFGKWLIETIHYLNKYQYLNLKVYLLSRDPSKFMRFYPQLSKSSWITYIKGDVRDFKFEFEMLDYIIHGAADVYCGRDVQDGDELYDVILNGARNITFIANSTSCEKVLDISSGAVYGNISNDKKKNGISEKTSCNPICTDAYAVSKFNAENYLVDNLNCDISIARCFSFCGAYMPLDGPYAFGNFVKDHIKGKVLTIRGDGTSKRSYMYAADLVIWLITILLMGKDRRIYNVGSSKPISILELAHEISQNRVEIKGLSVDGDDVYFPNTERSEQELGLKTSFQINESIMKVIDFYKSSGV
ncbi:TPA: NAD-dependent epimerase/dehydratase family protein [Vibrio cholerae]